MISLATISAFLGIGILAGLVSGLLGLGGGVVVVPLLAHILEYNGWDGQVMQVATGTSQAVILCTTTSAMLMHRRKISIPWRLVFALGLAASVGALIGRYIIQYIHSEWLSIGFFLFIVYTSVHLLRSNNWRVEPKPKPKAVGAMVTTVSSPSGSAAVAQTRSTASNYPSPLTCSAFGLVIGTFVSMLGVSGGVFIIPLLLHYGLTMVQASSIAVSSAILIAFSSTIGALVWGEAISELPYCFGDVYLPAWGCIALASICTAPIGVYFAHNIDSKRLKQYFALFLLLIAGHLLWQLHV